MKVNGQKITISGKMTLASFLRESNYNITKIAVERNYEIIPKKEYETTTLKDTDILEVVSFVGGG